MTNELVDYRERAQRGADMREDITLEFEEAVFGVTKQVQIRRLEECDQCKGSGAAPGKAPITCTTCGWEMAPRVLASRSNRAASAGSAAARSGRMSFTATSASSARCRASHTTPIPPWPSGRVSRSWSAMTPAASSPDISTPALAGTGERQVFRVTK